METTRSTATRLILFCCLLLVPDSRRAARPEANNFPAAADLYPLAVGNTWTYDIRSSDSKQAVLTWRITQKEEEKGQTVFHAWAQPSERDEPLDLCSDPQGIFECGSDRYLIRNPVRVGGSWSAHLQQVSKTPARDAFAITSAAPDCVVGVHRFAECVEIQETDDLNHLVSTTIYARSVGPVKYVYKEATLKTAKTVMTISKWKLFPVPKAPTRVR